jgi:hypothetical protein
MTARLRHDWLWLALLGALTGNGCASDTPSSAGSGGASGSGGVSGSGGASGGGGGSGGASGSGGATGSGGASGSGGQSGSGGSNQPGTGGAVVDSGTVADSGADTGSDGPGNDLPVGGGPTLDACFTGLRAAEGFFQIATKASADGRYRVRLALETANRVGTSGTSGWGAFRFGIETPAGNVCVTDAAALATAYKGSLHNCKDTFDLTAAGRRFLITAPDTDATHPISRLTIFMGATMLDGPIELINGTCTSNFPTCRSGGGAGCAPP